jgi:hypothetical protein
LRERGGQDGCSRYDDASQRTRLKLPKERASIARPVPECLAPSWLGATCRDHIASLQSLIVSCAVTIIFILRFVPGCGRWLNGLAIGTIMTFEQDPLRGALEIVVLTVFERPHERRESGQSETDCDWHQEEKIDHWRDPMAIGADVSGC